MLSPTSGWHGSPIDGHGQVPILPPEQQHMTPSLEGVWGWAPPQQGYGQLAALGGTGLYTRPSTDGSGVSLAQNGHVCSPAFSEGRGSAGKHLEVLTLGSQQHLSHRKMNFKVWETSNRRAFLCVCEVSRFLSFLSPYGMMPLKECPEVYRKVIGSVLLKWAVFLPRHCVWTDAIAFGLPERKSISSIPMFAFRQDMSLSSRRFHASY